MNSNFSILAFVFTLATATCHAHENDDICGPIQWPRHYGPYDYRSSPESRRALVEEAHFTRGVESLTRQATGSFAGDIQYTLFAFPNHPRALVAMQRLAQKEKTTQPQGAELPVECYFQRAVRFQPSDTVVRLLYANYLVDFKRIDDARGQVEAAVRTAPDNPFTHYNAGLIFFEIKDYGRALAEAHKADELGFTKQGLKDKLVAAGEWHDPVPDPPQAASSNSN